MSRIAAEELPSPVAVQAVQATWAPLAPAPPAAPAPARRAGLALIGGLAAVAAGVFGFLQLRDDGGSAGNPTVTVTASGDGVAGNSGITQAELGSAFTDIFGTTADAATLSCLTQQVGTDDGQAARLARREALSYEEARVAFVPFADCASDADFVGQLLAATVGLYQNGADEQCVALGLAELSVDDRANALALALVQPGELGNQLFNYFAGCAF